MTPSEETRGEKRIGTRTKKEWHNYLFDTTAHGYLDQEIPRFEVLLDAAFSREAEVEGLRAAIVWALGAGDSFRLRGDDEGAYWWRSELAKRAGGWGLIKVWPEYPQSGAALLTAEGQKKGEG